MLCKLILLYIKISAITREDCSSARISRACAGSSANTLSPAERQISPTAPDPAAQNTRTAAFFSPEEESGDRVCSPPTSRWRGRSWPRHAPLRSIKLKSLHCPTEWVWMALIPAQQFCGPNHNDQLLQYLPCHSRELLHTFLQLKKSMLSRENSKNEYADQITTS